MTPGETPQPPPAPDLRPLGVGEILDAAFRLLRQNFGTYVKIGAAFIVLPVLATGIYMMSQILFIRGQFIYVEDPDTYNVFIVFLGLIIRLSQLLAFGVLVHLSTRLYLNHQETARSIAAASRTRLGSFFGMSVLLGFYAIGVGIVASLVSLPFGPLAPVALIAVFVMWATYYSLTAPVFWHEGAGAGQSIVRSAALVRSRFWQVFTSLLLAFVIVGVFTIGLSALVVAFSLRMESALPYVLTTLGLESVGNLIAIIALAPIVTVVYFDGRVRKEGLDMKLKLDETGRNDSPPSVPW
jgi:hypothetical protein